MIYKILIPRLQGEIEDYDENDNNVACFNVYDEQGNNINDQIRYIIMFLSTNAMLGLGTELIRLANNYEEGKEVHILPASKKRGAEQSMGIYLTPDSCELIIKCQSFKSIQELLEDYTAERKNKSS